MITHLEQGGTYRHGYEENTRPREEIGMIKTLPHRIPSTFGVCIERHLNRTCHQKTSQPFHLVSSYLGVEPKLPGKLEIDLGISTLKRESVRWKVHCDRLTPYHSHALDSFDLPSRQSRFKNDFIVLKNPKAKGHNRVLRSQNSPTLQLNFDSGRVISYDLNGRIQHDPWTIRIFGMVTELVGLRLDEVLEPTLVHTEMIFGRKTAGCYFKREIVCLLSGLYTAIPRRPKEITEAYPRRSDPRRLFRSLCIFEIKCIVFRSHLLRGPWFRADDRISRPGGHVTPVF